MSQDMEFMQNIPSSGKERVVIAGGGFAGMKLAYLLSDSAYQVVLIDKNNFHQFQPLFYQVATAGLAPGDISFPLRKAFKKEDNVHVRMARVERILPEEKLILTDAGALPYDYLVLAMGGETNFFGNENVQKYAVPMKSVSDALFIRNKIIYNYEASLNTADALDRSALMSVVVVGGGPTGVELAGALAEMKRYILPKEYPMLNFEQMDVHLIEAGDRLLQGMSDASGKKALTFLEGMGVKVSLKTAVRDYDGLNVQLSDGQQLKAKTMLWAAGIKAIALEGIRPDQIGKGHRIRVDTYNRVVDSDDIFALGDIAAMETADFPNGHPQVAQVAIQQAKTLAKNLKTAGKEKRWKPFVYRDKGSMATIGKNLAVVDLPFLRFQGFWAWIVWLFVHLMAIVGVKNKLNVLMNWAWNYLSLDPSLRLLIRPRPVRQEKDNTSPWN